MKKIIALLLAAILVFTLAACGKKEAAPATTPAQSSGTSSSGSSSSGSSASSGSQSAAAASDHLLDKPMTFKVSFTENPDTAVGQIMPPAFEKISEMTNGDLLFEIYPSSQLGTNTEVMEQITNGAPIIGAAGYDNMSAFVESCIPYAIPYVFENTDEVCAFAKTAAFESLAQDMTAAGYVPISSGTLGVRHFISTFEITKAADVKGHIMRMGAANPCQSFITVMGGSPATSAWADNYSMLQSGQIESCEASIDLLWSSSLYEVCDYLCLSGHLSTPFMYVMSPDFWNQIPGEYQKIIKDVMSDATAELAAKLNGDASGYVQKFKDAGTKVCENPDIASFTSYLPALFDYLNIPTSKYDEIRKSIDEAMKN